MKHRTVRPPAVAGQFYPADPDQLAHEVDHHLAAALPPAGRVEGDVPKAIVAPHAGYVYSGPVAGSAYARLAGRAEHVRHVVLLGPAHRVPVRGLALPASDAFATPLGTVDIDGDARDRAATLHQVTVDDRPHRDEHSLEVQLPFLQRVLWPGWLLTPFVVGDAAPAEVAEVVDLLWGGDDTLLVVSTDLSHYLGYEEARRRDETTVAAILAGAVERIGPYDACGAAPVNGLLTAARHHGLSSRSLDLRNSGDTAGPRDRVVGYGAFEFV